MNLAHFIVLGALKFADEHESRMPEQIEEALSYAEPTGNVSAAEITEAVEQWGDHFEFLYNGRFEDLPNPSKQIIMREKKPWKNSKNKWSRTYTYGDGHSEVYSQESQDFAGWEKERLPVAVIQ